MQPISLPANQPRDRFYTGGRRVAEFRGLDTWAEFTPEDWVASTTAVADAAPVGLTVLPSGSLLVDAIGAEPEAWLGAEHLAAYGTDTRLLTKLLDPAQRLPIHAHPDDDFAARHLGTRHGKAEAWYILEPGTVHLGLTASLHREELLDLIALQRAGELLSRMHELQVAAGDTIYIPPGTLHAIGKDTLLLEVQQPEDLSILVEWAGFRIDGAVDGHLGLGFDTATRAITLDPLTQPDIDQLVRRQPGPGDLLSPHSKRYFRLALVAAGTQLSAGFAVATTHAGPAVLRAANGSACFLAGGSTTLIPYAYGDFEVESGSFLLARPPSPHTGG